MGLIRRTDEEIAARRQAKRDWELAAVGGDAGPPLTIQERVERIVAIEADDPPGGASYETCSEWQHRYWRELRLLHYTKVCGAYDDLDDGSQLVGVIIHRLEALMDDATFDDDDWWGNVWEATAALKAAMTCPEIVDFTPDDLDECWYDHWHMEECRQARLADDTGNRRCLDLIAG